MKFIDTAQDPWRHATTHDAQVTPLACPLLGLDEWLATRSSWPAHQRVGVHLPNDAGPTSLREDLQRLDLVALHFPKWTDGRAYSQARVLRSRLRYRGQLRATGEVLVDMVPLLHRTGFDAAELKMGQSLAAARRSLSHFNAHYQSDVAGGCPILLHAAATTDGKWLDRTEGAQGYRLG